MSDQTKATQEKLQRLGERIYTRDGSLPVLKRGEPAWHEWLDWRKTNGLGVGFMETRERWTVPMEYPPVNLDAALQSIGGGKLRQRFAE